MALVASALVLLIAAVVGSASGYLYARHESSAALAARVKDGIPAPDPQCLDDVKDLSHPWVTNGWWAGRVDGQVRQMSSQAATAMSLAGHKMDGVWLCPPR